MLYLAIFLLQKCSTMEWIENENSKSSFTSQVLSVGHCMFFSSVKYIFKMQYAFKICTYVVINKDKHFKWYIQSEKEKWHLSNMKAFTVGLNIDVLTQLLSKQE